MVTEKMIEALKPLADAVFNDNGDMTVQLPTVTAEDCIKAYFVVRKLEREAALSTDAEPFAYTEIEDGEWIVYGKTSSTYEHISKFPHLHSGVKALYDTPPAPSVALKVKPLKWKEDGKYLKARLGDREYMLNITSDGETWAGSTRPYVFGCNGTWGSVPNCSMVSLEAAKSACQADCQSRHDALSAKVQDVAGWQPANTAPRDGDEFIARCSPDFGSFSCIWDGARFVHYNHDGEYIAYPITEWMPFPAAAPAAKQEG